MKTPRKSPRPSLDSTLEQLEQRHRALLREVETVGLVLRGSIGRYRTRCGGSGCGCATDPDARHGPYFIWTRKVGGKTITAMLPDEEALRLKEWIANMRRLDRLVKELQKLGLSAAQAIRRG